MTEGNKAELLRGVQQFNTGDFFDCHDTIEEIWMENNGKERLFLQGLIQVAVGYYHRENGNFSGAASQLGKAIEKLAEYPDVYCNIDLKKLLATVRLHRTVFHGVVKRTYSHRMAQELQSPQIFVH